MGASSDAGAVHACFTVILVLMVFTTCGVSEHEKRSLIFAAPVPFVIGVVLFLLLTSIVLLRYVYVEGIKKPAEESKRKFVLLLAQEKTYCRPWDSRNAFAYGDRLGWKNAEEHEAWRAAAEAAWRCTHAQRCSEVEIVEDVANRRLEIRYRGKSYVANLQR